MNDTRILSPAAARMASCRDTLLARLDGDRLDQRLLRGETLFEQGSPADAIYVLQDGQLEISTLAADGRKLVMNVLSEGAIFGEIAVFEDGVRSATVAARTPSRVTRIERDMLLARMRAEPDLALDMLRLAVSHFSWVSAQLEAQAFQPLPMRLAGRISWLLSTLGDGAELRMSQTELAEHVGATREAVSKVLTGWKKDNLLSLGRGKLVVHDPDGLRAIADRPLA